ncbi:VPLPA-CTERM sorting domain-containing protein, partial [Gammaproteobacteria bacterium]|nr:VPLPA-CTERM sorting domain-containing protein [Gammaproteobacteria bacterium]
LDFDNYVTNGDGVITNGFELDWGFVGGGGASNGTFTWQPSSTTTLTQVNGNGFDLLSLDFMLNAAASPYEVTGYFQSGATISTSLSGDGAAFTWDSAFFDSGWTNLVAVEFVSNDLQAIDNIVIATVPIPAAVWLFGSALAGLGWMRRKQTV